MPKDQACPTYQKKKKTKLVINAYQDMNHKGNGVHKIEHFSPGLWKQEFRSMG